MFYGHAMSIDNNQKEAIYLSSAVYRFKITGDTFITLDGEFFTEEIEDTESLYIILLKLKSVLCPPDATAINQ